MSWVQSEKYRSAEIDPLFHNGQGIIDHMNDDHKDANLLYAKNLANLTDCTEASMLGIDRYGVTLRATTPTGPRMVRLGFSTALKNEEEARAAIIDLLDIAKAVNDGQSDRKE